MGKKVQTENLVVRVGSYTYGPFSSWAEIGEFADEGWPNRNAVEFTVARMTPKDEA